jgi:hypothetical protein
MSTNKKNEEKLMIKKKTQKPEERFEQQGQAQKCSVTFNSKGVE